MTMEPGEASIDNGHEGEEFGMLLSGTIHLRMEGSKTVHRVRKGECFYFKSDRPHAIENKGKRTATILWIVSPPTFH